MLLKRLDDEALAWLSLLDQFLCSSKAVLELMVVREQLVDDCLIN